MLTVFKKVTKDHANVKGEITGLEGKEYKVSITDALNILAYPTRN